MTDAELAAIDDRWRGWSAGPGSWQVESDPPGCDELWTQDEDGEPCMLAVVEADGLAPVLAAAPDDVARLLREVSRLRALVAKLGWVSDADPIITAEPPARCGRILSGGRSAACTRPAGHRGEHQTWPDELLPPEDWPKLGYEGRPEPQRTDRRKWCTHLVCTATATHGPDGLARVCWQHAGDWPRVDGALDWRRALEAAGLVRGEWVWHSDGEPVVFLGTGAHWFVDGDPNAYLDEEAAARAWLAQKARR